MLEPRLFLEDGWTVLESTPATTSLSGYVAQCEREYIERALQDCGNQIGKAAARLGISRKNLWEKLRKLGVRQAERNS